MSEIPLSATTKDTPESRLAQGWELVWKWFVEEAQKEEKIKEQPKQRKAS